MLNSVLEIDPINASSNFAKTPEILLYLCPKFSQAIKFREKILKQKSTISCQKCWPTPFPKRSDLCFHFFNLLILIIRHEVFSGTFFEFTVNLLVSKNIFNNTQSSKYLPVILPHYSCFAYDLSFLVLFSIHLN